MTTRDIDGADEQLINALHSEDIDAGFNSDKSNVLLLAVYSGHGGKNLRFVKSLIEAGADVNNLNALNSDPFGMTEFHYQCDQSQSCKEQFELLKSTKQIQDQINSAIERNRPSDINSRSPLELSMTLNFLINKLRRELNSVTHNKNRISCMERMLKGVAGEVASEFNQLIITSSDNIESSVKDLLNKKFRFTNLESDSGRLFVDLALSELRDQASQAGPA